MAMPCTQTQRQLQHLQQRYDDLFERVPCSISVIDKDLRIVRANRMLREIFGEVEGKSCYEVYKGRHSACPFCPVLKTFEDGESHSSKQTGVNRHGRPIHYVVSSLPLKNGHDEIEHVIEMSIDITETYELSRELSREGAFRHTITESLIDALVAVDEEGLVRMFNPAAERLFGMSSDEVVGKQSFQRFFPDAFRRILVNGKSHLVLNECSITDANGEEIPVRLSGSVLRDEHGVVIGGVASFQDLRELKQLEQEKLSRERLAAVGQTVAVLAHAIKNMLVGVQGGIHKLKRGRKKQSEDMTKKGLEMLDRAFTRMADLTRGLLDLSRDREPALTRIDPVDLAERIRAQFADTALDRGIDLVLESEPTLTEVPLDAEGIQSCLDNLVSNALDALDDIDQERKRVTLHVGFKNDVLSYVCEDNGPGMDEETQGKLFEMFYTTKGIRGTGLGLAVTRKIIQEHGGEIRVESRPGQGARFEITLPLPALIRNMARQERSRAALDAQYDESL